MNTSQAGFSKRNRRKKRMTKARFDSSATIVSQPSAMADFQPFCF
jgi:hypothetical protein